MMGLNIRYSKYREAAVIYNPIAGRLARRHHLLQRITEVLHNVGTRARLIPTTGPNTAADLTARVIEEGAELILVAGGDGTINEVANGMVHSHVPLGILPAGTANVLAHELKMSGGIHSALRHLPECISCRISMGRLRGSDYNRHFLCMAGVGLDAQIVYDLNTGLKAAIGKFAYYAGGFRQIARPLPQFDIEILGQRRRCGFVLVSRVRNYGGDLEIARGASLLRSDFEVLSFEGSTSIGYLRYLAGVVLGRVDKVKGCSIWRTTSIRFDSPSDHRILTQIDGELACPLPVRLDIVPEAITLLVPPGYFEKERVFQQATVNA